MNLYLILVYLFLKSPKTFAGSTIISLILSVKFSIQESKKEIKYSFSNAKEMSGFILANGYDDDKVYYRYS